MVFLIFDLLITLEFSHQSSFSLHCLLTRLGQCFAETSINRYWQPHARNRPNIIRLSIMQDSVPEDIESISSFEPPQSPDSSYDNLLLGSDDYAKEPPLVPPHLQRTLLNSPSSYMEIPPCLSRPQHVVLNHLYMQRGKSGPSIVALGTTHRFLAKYVTAVLYKSFQR